MTAKLILASSSKVRAELLSAAGIPFEVDPAHIDEAEVKNAMLAAGAGPHDIADMLAELKALSKSRNNTHFILGADQTLALDGKLFDKAETKDDAIDKLKLLRGKTHSLFAAACIAQNNRIIWRHLNEVKLTMRSFSDEFLERYANENPDSLFRSVGAYELEGHGSQLMASLNGDYFSILGLPLLELQSFLRTHGILPT